MRIKVVKTQIKELMLVSPLLLTCCKALALSWSWRWICDFGNKICRRSFSNTIDKNPKEWRLQEEVKADTKTEQEALSIVEPLLFLLLGKSNPRKVRFELKEEPLESINIKRNTWRTNSLIKLRDAK